MKSLGTTSRMTRTKSTITTSGTTIITKVMRIIYIILIRGCFVGHSAKPVFYALGGDRKVIAEPADAWPPARGGFADVKTAGGGG